MGRFSIMGPRSGQHWFRVGTIDVTSTVLITAICSASIVIVAFAPNLLIPLQLVPASVFRGHLWQLVTWPLVNGPDILTVISVVFFWWLGSGLEALLGRRRFLWFVGLLSVIPAIAVTVVGLLIGQSGVISGISQLDVALIVAFAAVYPAARSFLGIPFWGIAAVVVGIDILGYISIHEWLVVLFLVVLTLAGLMTVRSFGISTVSWIPPLPLPGFMSGDASRSRERKKRRATHLQVVQEADVDSLLDKIAEHGVGSLTPQERRRLDEQSRKPHA